MAQFRNGEVEIAYLDSGEGEPIVLVHGFASNKEVNWVNTGWMTTLTRAGFRAIALDNRGHGASSKLYDPAAYHSATMAEDVRALLDHLQIERADVMGYSMGARIAAFFAVEHPGRVRSLVLGGLGIRLVEGVGLPESIAEALEAPSLADVSGTTERMFRAFAEQTQLRPQGACRLHAWFAPGIESRTGGGNHRARLGRGRNQGPGRRFCTSAGRAHSGRPRARYSGPRPYVGGRRQGIQSGRH